MCIKRRVISKLLVAISMFACSLSAVKAHATDSCENEIHELKLNYVGANLLPAVKGAISDSDATFVFDTGSATTMLFSAAASRRGIGFKRTKGTIKGVGGAVDVSAAVRQTYTIGDITVSSVSLPVVDAPAFSDDADGIIGADWSSKMKLELRLKDNFVRFFSADCDPSWILSSSDQLPLISSAADLADSRIFVKIVLNGIPMLGLLDTGSNRTTVFRRAAERAGFDAKKSVARIAERSSGLGKESRQVWDAYFSLEIGPERFNYARLHVLDELEEGAAPTADILIGNDWLREHKIYVSRQHHEVRFKSEGNVNPFGSSADKPERWILAEADKGNPDAMYAVGAFYAAGKNFSESILWFRRAANAGHAAANYISGRNEVRLGNHKSAIPLLKNATRLRPGDIFSMLWLYLAEAASSEPSSAAANLRSSLKSADNRWPRPIADFYAGQIDEAALMKIAEPDKYCESQMYVIEWYRAAGNSSRAEALKTNAKKRCVSAVAR